mgnify:FL=1
MSCRMQIFDAKDLFARVQTAFQPVQSLLDQRDFHMVTILEGRHSGNDLPGRAHFDGERVHMFRHPRNICTDRAHMFVCCLFISHAA